MNEEPGSPDAARPAARRIGDAVCAGGIRGGGASISRIPPSLHPGYGADYDD